MQYYLICVIHVSDCRIGLLLVRIFKLSKFEYKQGCITEYASQIEVTRKLDMNRFLVSLGLFRVKVGLGI